MSDTLKNLKNQFSKYFSQKKYSVSGGTAIFLIFNVLLITGFCKFSFYVLKNHRSLIERDALIKTYVDVQPSPSKRKGIPAYPDPTVQNSAVPAPFFVKTAQTDTSAQIAKNIPLPVLNKSEEPAVTKPVSRPPVIRQTARAVEPSAPTLKIKEKKTNDVQAVSLDSLMASGLNLLDESEKTITTSAALLEEEQLPEPNQIVQEKTPEASSVSKRENDRIPPKKQAAPQKKESQKATRWVDVAELRRQLSQPAVSGQDEIGKQNIALLNMNDARQVAASDINTFTDVGQKNAETEKTLSDPAKENKQTALNPASKTPSGIALNETDISLSASKTESRPVSPIETAVVQDIPFAGTAQTSETTQKTDSPSVSVKQIALSGNTPSLWKVAKVKGVSKKSAPVKTEEKTEETESPVSGTLPKVAQSDIIYRNGKATASTQSQEKKSLNWLDRQEAAVWTSMSQSDAPSVWSSASETTSASDRAKAFRVADEQSAESNEINSAPVRIVGEENKPEAKSKPILLPLGSAPNTVSSPATFTGYPPAFPETAPDESAASSDKQPLGEKKEPEQNGLMDRLLSFFGKNDSQNSLPNIGSGNTVETGQKETGSNIFGKASPFKPQKPSVIKTNTTSKPEESKILPTELRLTFKPNSAEMSAQSIKWIKAFGQRAKKDIQNAVEVRMSNMDASLQNKRFAMIRNTLIGTGLEDVQIIPVVTDRTPHTIVLRTIVLPEEGYTEYTSDNNGIKERLYYKQW